MTAEQIVRALAAADPTRNDWHSCAFCGRHPIDRTASKHDPDCSWRMAVEWIAQQEVQILKDRLLYGVSFTKSGRRVDPMEVISDED